MTFSSPNYVLTIYTDKPKYYMRGYKTFQVKVELKDYSTLYPV